MRHLQGHMLGAVGVFLFLLARPVLSFLAPGGVAVAHSWAGRRDRSCAMGARLQAPSASRSRHGRGASVRMAWEEFFDENYNVPYYYNSQTGETTWEKPAVEKPKVGGGTTTVFRQGTAAPVSANTAQQRGGTRLVSPRKAGASAAPAAASPGRYSEKWLYSDFVK